MENRPPAEIDITEQTVAELLAEQRPDLVNLPLTKAGEGWDNAMFRLGTDLAVRLPRREASVPLIEHEQRWLPVLAPRLPIPIPAPVHAGTPGNAFGWPWSIIPWVEGDIALGAELGDPASDARRLGLFLSALHQPADPRAPDNPYRGQDVRSLEERVISNLSKADLPSDDHVLARWRRAADVAVHAGEPRWVHGDLHGLNVLVAGGQIASVIDFGDITAGDPAVDLPIGWMLFDGPEREQFRAAVGADDAQWSRGWAWAMHFAIVYLANSADHPQLQRQGDQLLATLMADQPDG